MLKIEQFIEEQFGIKLNKPQLEMIAMIAAGEVKVNANLDARRYGNDVVQKAVLAYLQDGMKTIDTEKVDRFEVIDGNGRAYVRGSIYNLPFQKIDLSYQDDGRTLKVFLTEE